MLSLPLKADISVLVYTKRSLSNSFLAHQSGRKAFFLIFVRLRFFPIALVCTAPLLSVHLLVDSRRRISVSISEAFSYLNAALGSVITFQTVAHFSV